MEYNKLFTRIIIIAIVCISMNITIVYGEDNTNNATSNTVDVQYPSKVTDEQYNSILKILEDINKEVKNIDDKIESIKTLEEYDKYPAVRLNIDTPFFGIYSVVNSKLKIKNEVSTVDVANGYSIRNVINQKVIKIESFQVSNIVVITRDVKIDKSMTYSDAETCIFKLLDYLNQAKSVNKFVDKQLLSMLSGYFSNDKSTDILNINDQINEINGNLNICLKELSYISAFTSNDVTSDITTLYTYKDNMTSIQTQINSALISKTKLDEIYKNIIKTNADIKVFKYKIDKEYLDASNNINLEQAAFLINTKMSNELQYLQSYVDNSKVEILQTNTSSTETSADTSSTATTNTLDSNKEYKDVYQVASAAIIDSMKKDKDKANDILSKIVANKLNNDDTNKVQLNANQTLDDLMQTYISFLNKENTFLNENIKSNINDIKNYSDINIKYFDDLKYIYTNVSDILTQISDSLVSDNVVSNESNITKLKNVLQRVLECSKNLKQQEVANPTAQ